MENRKEFRKKILNQPEYWIEKLNMDLYDALIEYKEANKISKGDLANYLGISAGRLSQILNDGDSNFNTSTLFSILLKIDKFPLVNFIGKDIFINEEMRKTGDSKMKVIRLDFKTDAFSKVKPKPGRPKTIRLQDQSEVKKYVGTVGQYYAEAF